MTVVRIDMSEPVNYLLGALEKYIAEPEVSFSVFSLVLKSAFESSDVWVRNPNSFDDAVSYLVDIMGSQEEAQHVCKIVEGKIFSIIIEFIPNITFAELHSQTFKYELKDDTQLYLSFLAQSGLA